MKSIMKQEHIKQTSTFLVIGNILKRSFLVVVFLFVSKTTLLAQKNLIPRTISFDREWSFFKGDYVKAKDINYDDSSWRKVNLPHDWSIEDLPNQIPDSIVGPFSKAALSQRDGGFTVGGTAWYRKHFVLDKATSGKSVFIQFDGVYMNADVWINGKHLGNHPNGYTSFYYDLTPYLLPVGQSNVIAVQVKNEGLNSRWYSGSGIYRHVWLTVTNPLHIDIWGTYITTPRVSDKMAKVSIETTIKNVPVNKPYTLLTELYTATGKLVGSDKKVFSALNGDKNLLNQTITVNNPTLWSLENPSLYKAKVKIVQDNKVIDETTTTFGIRSLHFDATSGFTLNGKNIKLKGGNIHHDNGPLGAVAIDRAEERKIELLKKNGYNAIRLSHNPPSPYLLDVCDRLGMLVINEAFDVWNEMKKPQDYHLYFKEWWKRDIESMVLRDRNHPSIIMWSTGNEIPETIDTIGYETGKRLSDAIRSLDATRPTTIAIPKFITVLSGRKGKKWDDTAPSFATVDVCGYNYAINKYDDDHKKYPNRVMYESEAFPPQVYDSWEKAKKAPYTIGMFTWTAMDYIGEAGLGAPRLVPKDVAVGSNLFLDPAWPIFNAYSGELDLIGDKKVNSYYLDVVWERSKIELFVQPSIPDGYKEEDFYYNFPVQIKSWSFPGEEGKKMKVFVHSQAQLIKLELNGRVVGTHTKTLRSITAEFEVPYEPGSLVARCYDNGKEIGSDTLRTVGKPHAIKLRADRGKIKADLNDLSYINVEVVDEKGNIVPYVDDLIVKYQISGNGEIAGVGNGNPTDVSSFQQPQKKVYRGRGLVIVRPNDTSGKIILKAQAKGLVSGSIEISSK